MTVKLVSFYLRVKVSNPDMHAGRPPSHSAHLAPSAQAELSGACGQGLDWFRSYLSERTQTFIVGGAESHSVSMDCSVPHGSALGPLEFISYTDEVSEIFSRHAVNYHLFADDKQLSESDKVSDTSLSVVYRHALLTSPPGVHLESSS